MDTRPQSSSIPVRTQRPVLQPSVHTCFRIWLHRQSTFTHVSGTGSNTSVLARALVPRIIDTLQACTLQNSGLRLVHSPWAIYQCHYYCEGVCQTWQCQKWPPWLWHSPGRKSDQRSPAAFSPQRPQQPLTWLQIHTALTLRIYTVFTDFDLSWWSLHGNCFWYFLEQKPPDSTQAALIPNHRCENLSPVKWIHRVRRRLTPQASRF